MTPNETIVIDSVEKLLEHFGHEMPDYTSEEYGLNLHLLSTLGLDFTTTEEVTLVGNNRVWKANPDVPGPVHWKKEGF